MAAESQKKQENSRRTSTSASLTALKPLTVQMTTNCGKFLKRWEQQTTFPVSRETYMQVKKQQLELDMGQQTGSKVGKEYVKAVYCHPVYLTQATSVQHLHPRRAGIRRNRNRYGGRFSYSSFKVLFAISLRECLEFVLNLQALATNTQPCATRCWCFLVGKSCLTLCDPMD